jgi:hypothetical protein
MPQASIRPGADQLVIFFDGNSTTPILAEVPACPDGQRSSRPRQRNGGDVGGIAARENSLAKESDTGRTLEQENEAYNFDEHDAVTRHKGFTSLRPLGVQGADDPIADEDDPGNIDENAPDCHRIFITQCR